jgi:hypothetical protein
MSSPFSQGFMGKKDALFMTENQESTFGPKGSNPNPGVYQGIQEADAKKGSATAMLSPFNKKEPAMDPCSAEFDYEVASDAGMTSEQIREARKKCAKTTKPKQNVKQVREDEDQVKAAASRA